MSANRTPDLTMIDSILTPGRAAATGNETGLYREWLVTVSALRDHGQSGRLIQHQAIQGAMRRLTLGRDAAGSSSVRGVRTVDANDSAPWGWGSRYHGLLSGLMILVAAGLLTYIITLFVNYHPDHIAFVDFGGHKVQTGSEDQPFHSLGAAVEAVRREGRIILSPGTSPERMRITKPVRIEARGGAARIGAPSN